jgi:hypothetical protein
VLARPLRPPTLREDPTPSTNRHQVVLAPDDAPPLVGVHLVRPRPLIPRGLRALQLDTSHTAASHGNDENDQHKQIPRQPRLHPVRVAGSFAHALLTRKALMGAAMTLDVYAGLFGDDLDAVADRLHELASAATAADVSLLMP